MSLIGLLGDAHGKYDVIFDIIAANPDVSRWFQVGDLGGEHDNYPSFPSNFHFIQGNHENWNYVRELRDKKNPLLLPNGSVTQYKIRGGSFVVGVMGGNFSARFADNHTASLPGSRIRHFTNEDYEELIRQKGVLGKSAHIDIFLSHEAPSPFHKQFHDIGIMKITELIKTLRPGIHFFGHHHMFKIMDVSGVVSIGLDYAYNSYVLYDVEDRRIRKIDYAR
jgi:hypothetical protein